MTNHLNTDDERVLVRRSDLDNLRAALNAVNHKPRNDDDFLAVARTLVDNARPDNAAAADNLDTLRNNYIDAWAVLQHDHGCTLNHESYRNAERSLVAAVLAREVKP